ncbi:DegT/DnrJ/EryC1/StrS family aminotransferase [Prochlorococcus sp. MIT 1303]|uniref:DegT/DnrJ/EryC1/StrS family aminotransferase n=1 Tax=Prochlorococcus sp. MIT 1303 TaxID=1723647 RepID=UPI0007B3EE27|nr:DegT/DnrJ/EryC1/StrS family aminotransferase [Prochlorococcus sp. MIT 1303]KZR70348.1 dTDP-4-amino-4,6-dideoxy-D-glucose transaminase [Prochlorococcus sp. MIT 1303]
MSFDDLLHVGRPNLGNREKFLSLVNEILDRRWLTNQGPVVKMFENTICEYLGVKHALTICNATTALEIAAKALGIKGEVIIPSFTFIATAHALQWLGVKPIFCDVGPRTHNIDPTKIEALVNENTSGILGVHMWGRPCDIETLQLLSSKYNIPVFYDASHAFGCSYKSNMIGNFGSCEVFSFHATKIINSLEGGLITTNDSRLASKIDKMRNFGFTDFDKVDELGINGKMNEISAAMGLTNLECIDEFIAKNKANYDLYRKYLSSIPYVKLIEYSAEEYFNYHYIILYLDTVNSKRSRDELISILHSNNILARRYFSPGCHRMMPYQTMTDYSRLDLRVTELLSESLIALPNGQSIDDDDIAKICSIINNFISSH